MRNKNGRGSIVSGFLKCKKWLDSYDSFKGHLQCEIYSNIMKSIFVGFSNLLSDEIQLVPAKWPASGHQVVTSIVLYLISSKRLLFNKLAKLEDTQVEYISQKYT